MREDGKATGPEPTSKFPITRLYDQVRALGKIGVLLRVGGEPV